MKEVRENIILAAGYRVVHSHNINNPGSSIVHKLLEYNNTLIIYLTIEVLEGNTGDIFWRC